MRFDIYNLYFNKKLTKNQNHTNQKLQTCTYWHENFFIILDEKGYRAMHAV